MEDFSPEQLKKRFVPLVKGILKNKNRGNDENDNNDNVLPYVHKIRI